MTLGIESVDGRHGRRVFDRQPPASHALIEKPDPAGDRHGRRIANEGRNRVRIRGVEHMLEHERVEPLMAKGETDMIRDMAARPVPLIEHGPAVFVASAALDVTAGNGARCPNRGRDPKAMNRRSPAGQLCLLRDEAILECQWCVEIRFRRSKYV